MSIEKAEKMAFSIAEVASMIGISTKSVRRLVARKYLHSCKGLRHIRITRSSLYKYLGGGIGLSLNAQTSQPEDRA